MKNYGPIYTILATMAVAAMAIGAEPARENRKVEVSKLEAGKSDGQLVRRSADIRLPERRIAIAIAFARARKRTG